jgi:hypothetical protein
MVEQVQNTEPRSPKSKMALLTEVFGGGEFLSVDNPFNGV